MTVDIETLLRELTIDEKILLLAGKNFWETHLIPRLNISSLKVTDGPSGARGETSSTALARLAFLPVSLWQLRKHNPRALMCSWGRPFAFIEPPLSGRNFESLSEDPLLSGALASDYVCGLQEQRVAPSVKQFFANDQDTRRFVVNEIISERALREIYLKPFEIVVKASKPWTLMSAYPKVNGDYIDANGKWFTQVLRGEWGFDGLVTTDWGATSTPQSISNGLDLEMPGPARHATAKNIHKEIKEGRLTDKQLNGAVGRLLTLLKKVGKFADRHETPTEQAINLPHHRALIREAGVAGMVLLKNERNVLPLDLRNKPKISTLGPLAQHASAHGGGSSLLACHYKVSPMGAFTDRYGDQLEITYSKGYEIYRSFPDFVGQVFNSQGVQGFDVQSFQTYDGTSPAIKNEELRSSYFTTHDQIDIKAEAMSARMTGAHKPTQPANTT